MHMGPYKLETIRRVEQTTTLIIEDDPRAMAFPLTPLPRHRLARTKDFIWHDVCVPLTNLAGQLRGFW